MKKAVHTHSMCTENYTFTQYTQKITPSLNVHRKLHIHSMYTENNTLTQ